MRINVREKKDECVAITRPVYTYGCIFCPSIVRVRAVKLKIRSHRLYRFYKHNLKKIQINNIPNCE